MRKSYRYGIAAVPVLIILFGTVWWSTSGTSDPVYKGKRLSVWLRGYDPPSSSISGRDFADRSTAAMHAVLDAGTNAIPRLMAMLRMRDSRLKRELMDLMERPRFLKMKFTRAVTLNFANVPAAVQFALEHIDPEAAARVAAKSP